MISKAVAALYINWLQSRNSICIISKNATIHGVRETLRIIENLYHANVQCDIDGYCLWRPHFFLAGSPPALLGRSLSCLKTASDLKMLSGESAFCHTNIFSIGRQVITSQASSSCPFNLSQMFETMLNCNLKGFPGERNVKARLYCILRPWRSDQMITRES